MRLLAVGLSHRTAPVELRESVDFARSGLDTALHALGANGASQEAVVLSTCNRAEIYAVGESDAAGDALRRFFCDYHNVDSSRLAEHLYCHRGIDAARHLFRVAAGLDSGSGQGGVCNRERAAVHRYGDTPPVPYGLCRRQARA